MVSWFKRHRETSQWSRKKWFWLKLSGQNLAEELKQRVNEELRKNYPAGNSYRPDLGESGITVQSVLVKVLNRAHPFALPAIDAGSMGKICCDSRPARIQLILS